MALTEASWRLQSGAEADIARAQDGAAMSWRIQEWLATPEGTMAHHPSWGNNLSKFKHDPIAQGSSTAVMLEMSIARKLPQDIEDLRIASVHVEVEDIDLCRVTIAHQFGNENLQIKL